MYKLQVQEWDPVIEWFCNRFQVDVKKNRNIGGVEVNTGVKGVISRYLMSYNFAAVHGKYLTFYHIQIQWLYHVRNTV